MIFVMIGIVVVCAAVYWIMDAVDKRKEHA